MNIEATVITYLTTALENIPVRGERPANPPDTYIVVDKTGAELVNFINQATILVEAVAPSKYDASNLINDVKSAMQSITQEEADVTMCSLETEYDDTDTALKDYRYSAVFNISYY